MAVTHPVPTLRASAVDRALDLLWQRYGPWLALIVVGAGWTVGIGVTTVGGIAFGRIARLSTGRTVDLVVAMDVAELFTGITAVTLAAGSIRIWARVAESQSPDEVWAATTVLIPRLLRISAFCACCISGPLLSICVAVITQADLGFLLGAVTGIYAANLYLVVTGSFLVPLGVRALLRGAGQPRRSSSVQLMHGGFARRVVVAIPASCVIAAWCGVWVGASPGTSGTAMFWRGVIAAVVVSGFGSVTAYFLANSTLGPLRELIDGTQRATRGEFGQPVPELSLDEFGLLTHSFNEMLDGLAERRRLAIEVRESRSRIVAAADESRRRVERNIHDGAQQRLVALALDLRMLKESVPMLTGDELAAGLDRATEDLKAALGELRELARGLHPAILTTDGLRPAIEQLAARAAIPVTVEVNGARLPEALETACYFTVAEALANVGKYAAATQASVCLHQHDDQVELRVSDNGRGGADPHDGSGLTGLADRIAALNGTLRVESPVGQGTVVCAELPLNGVRPDDRSLVR